MITKIEADREGNPLRVFHRGGEGGRYVWTHPLEVRAACNACQHGTLPDDVKGSPK